MLTHISAWLLSRCSAAAAYSAIAMCVLCALGWLAWSGGTTRAALHAATQQALRVTEIRGTIAHLDEWLTMSARMAAATGDVRWVARYNEAEPRLDAAITEAVALATPEIAAELSRTTDDANRRLVDLERASLALGQNGDPADASALLDSMEYARLKEVYSSGMSAFHESLDVFARARTQTLNRRTWLEGICSSPPL